MISSLFDRCDTETKEALGTSILDEALTGLEHYSPKKKSIASNKAMLFL